MRATALLVLLAAAATVPGAGGVPAHATSTIPSAFGTAIIDGTKSPGEWSGAPVAVFSGLVGSQLYVMDDNVNLYLGLFVPDATLTASDQFGVRFDSKNDGLTLAGDDEIAVDPPASFGDTHYDAPNTSWGFWDAHQDGAGAGAQTAGGNWFEMSHPLSDGDPQDLFVMPGQTIGLCVRYSNDGTGSSLDVFPTNCLYGGAVQSDYIQYTISSGHVGVDADAAGGPRLALLPNPMRPGGTLELRFAVPAPRAAVHAGVYAVSGRELARLADGVYAAGEHSTRWALPATGPGALDAGVYFVRAWIAGEPAQATLVVVR